MDRAIEFSINHWPLVSSFFILVILAIFSEVRRSGKALSTHDLTQKINAEDALVLDIRQAADFKAGHVVNAINIPLASIESRASELEKYKQKPIVVVCQLGQQSGQAVQKLQRMEFEQVFRLGGGMSGWKSESLPVVRT